jgi:hypothetical protein
VRWDIAYYRYHVLLLNVFVKAESIGENKVDIIINFLS